MRGAERRLRLHPLFWLAGVLSAFTGTLFVFCCAVIAAIEHECAHAFAARRYGYALGGIVLMPYGAVISGDLTGIGRRQEIAVYAAGPLANGATALAFAALWWLFPETYPYTDVAAYVSFSLFLVNLLPAYPLDGGRILRLLLLPLCKGKTKLVCGAVTLGLSAAVLGYFIASCFSQPAFTALAFSVFLAAGVFGGEEYRRVFFDTKKFLRGVPERRIAIAAQRPVKDALRFLRDDGYLTLLLFEEGNFAGEVTEEELVEAFERGDHARPLFELLPQISEIARK